MQIILWNILYALRAHFCFPYEGFLSHIRYRFPFHPSYLIFFIHVLFLGLRCLPFILHLSLASNPFYSCSRTHFANEKSCPQSFTYEKTLLHMYSFRTFCQWKYQRKKLAEHCWFKKSNYNVFLYIKNAFSPFFVSLMNFRK